MPQNSVPRSKSLFILRDSSVKSDDSAACRSMNRRLERQERLKQQRRRSGMNNFGSVRSVLIDLHVLHGRRERRGRSERSARGVRRAGKYEQATRATRVTAPAFEYEHFLLSVLIDMHVLQGDELLLTRGMNRPLGSSSLNYWIIC